MHAPARFPKKRSCSRASSSCTRSSRTRANRISSRSHAASLLPFTAPRMASAEEAADRSAKVTPVLKREERKTSLDLDRRPRSRGAGGREPDGRAAAWRSRAWLWRSHPWLWPSHPWRMTWLRFPPASTPLRAWRTPPGGSKNALTTARGSSTSGLSACLCPARGLPRSPGRLGGWGCASRWSTPKRCTNTPTPIRASEPV